MKTYKTTYITTLILIAISIFSTGCAYNSTMGQDDRFQVASTASFFAPSVTTVLDTKTDSASTYAGPSIVGQVANAAGTVAGGYLLGQGIGKSGTKVTQNGGGASANGVGLGGNASASVKASASSSAAAQSNAAAGAAVGSHSDGLEINH